MDDVVKCSSCNANTEVKDNQRKSFCTFCGTKVADWDDPHFGNNMTNAKFWEKRAEQIQADLGGNWLNELTSGNLGFGFDTADSNNFEELFNTDFSLKSLIFGKKSKPKIDTKTYLYYKGDKSVKDKQLDKLVQSKKHLFIYADENTIKTFGKEVRENTLSGNYADAYSYVANIKLIPKLGDHYALTAGIIKSVFYYKPYNDFAEIAEGLATTNSALTKVPASHKVIYCSVSMRYMCQVAAKLFEDCYLDRGDKWFVETMSRLFHFLEIVLTLVPVTECVKVEYGDDFKRAFAKMHSSCPPILARLKSLVAKNSDELKKLERIEKRLDASAKELAL
ncbi:MAG: hypothetical protein FWC80_02340 [Firmicutes bacterium]|nr:hypothetical protein [Bacillota bacterium]